jgi:hypothetical protein
MPDFPRLALNPGIMLAVQVLSDRAVETLESCEGGHGHAFLEPTVRFGVGRPEEGWHAFSTALAHGFPVACLRLYWDVEHGHHPTGPHWELVLRPVKPLAEPDAGLTPRAVGSSLPKMLGLNPFAVRAVVMVVVNVALRWKFRLDSVVWRYFSHVAPP